MEPDANPDGFPVDDLGVSIVKNSPIQLEIISAGLAGAVLPYGGGFVIRYRLLNSGPSLKVHLSLYQNTNNKDSLTSRLGLADKAVDLPAVGKVEGEWIVADAYGWYMTGAYSGNIYLAATDDRGQVLAATQALDYRSTTSPFVILALNKEQGIEIESKIRTVHPSDKVGAVPIASVYEKLPDLWYEYKAANRVLQARPLGSMSALEKEALKRYVSMGGTLLIATEYVPDWTVDDTAAFNRGIGRAILLPSLSDPQLLSDGSSPASALTPMLQSGYRLPDFRIFIAWVVLIVLLIGPVLHIVFAKLGRREWIWIGAPLLSIAAAAGMYGLAQAVKGDKSAVEIHHLFVGGEGATQFFAMTAVRLQSAEKGFFDVKIEAMEPTPNQPSDAYQYRNFPQASLIAERGSILFSHLFMQKWSTRDVSADSVSAPFPLRRTAATKDDVHIRNLSPGNLSGLYYYNQTNWYNIPGQIMSGEERTLSLTTDRVINDNDSTLLSQSSIAPVLYNLRTAYPGREILATTCSPSGLPKVRVTPTPSIVRESSHCVFLFTKEPEAARPPLDPNMSPNQALKETQP
jgi:hypothetical protein